MTLHSVEVCCAAATKSPAANSIYRKGCLSPRPNNKLRRSSCSSLFFSSSPCAPTKASAARERSLRMYNDFTEKERERERDADLIFRENLYTSSSAAASGAYWTRALFAPDCFFLISSRFFFSEMHKDTTKFREEKAPAPRA